MTAPESPVLVADKGSVRIVTLSRPHRMNAWTEQMQELFSQALVDADADPAVRAIVITGAGRAFCAGADMDALSDAAGGELPDPDGPPRSYPFTVRKPMIAAINGAAAGVGFVQAMFCDVRFCSAGAKLTTSFARRGLVAECGVAWILPRLVGYGKAMDLLLSGRVVLAEEALSIGLVDRVCPSEEVLPAALEYATMLAENCSPTAMAVMKHQVRESSGMSFAAADEAASALMRAGFAHPDVLEGAASFMEKRPPRFRPLGPA